MCLERKTSCAVASPDRGKNVKRRSHQTVFLDPVGHPDEDIFPAVIESSPERTIHLDTVVMEDADVTRISRAAFFVKTNFETAWIREAGRRWADLRRRHGQFECRGERCGPNADYAMVAGLLEIQVRLRGPQGSQQHCP